MFDRVQPFELKYIQKASPKEGDAFDFSLIYKFYTDKTEEYQRLKYIIRAESYDDVFAIKFYAARDRKLDNKYNRTIKAHGYKGAMGIFITCASVIPMIIKKYPNASFAVNGAESMDMESDKVEGRANNQRFRIYKNIALNLFGRKMFEHIEYKNVSSYILVNRKSCQDVQEKAECIKEMFFSRGFEG